ncbi:hypothetical protein PMAYCL1PPCAC_08851, partial [Pristionchus mayeri]
SFSFWLAMSFITIERAIASHFVSSYEQQFRSVPAQMLIISIFVSLRNVCSIYLLTINEPAMAVISLSNTFINLGVMYIVKRINTRRNTLERNLSYRFQVKEIVMLSAIFPLTYAIGLLRCAAIRKIMISQRMLVEKPKIISEHDQYELARNAQNELWKVS